MITLPKALADKFNDWLGCEAVDTNRHAEYRKWVRYYLDFCHKDGHGYLEERSFGLFAEKLKVKRQRSSRIEEVPRAVRLYYRAAGNANSVLQVSACKPK